MAVHGKAGLGRARQGLFAKEVFVKTTDFRNTAFNEIKAMLSGKRAEVYRGLCLHGPCTTEELARKMALNILSVRPRVTELCQLGLAGLANAQSWRSKHGTYLGIPIEAARTVLAARPEGNQQMALRLEA